MPYTKVHEDWEDLPSVNTPINAAALEQIEQGIADAQSDADSANGSIGDHLSDSSGAHAASAISFNPVGTVGASNVQAAIAEVAADAVAEVSAHTGDSSGAHAASAISFTPTGGISSGNVQSAIAEVAASVAGGVLPDGDYGDITVSGTGTAMTLNDTFVQPGDDADTLGSGDATDGYVLTADGAGGAAWEEAPSTVTVEDVAGTSDTIASGDLGKILRYTDAGLVTVTLPAGLPAGSIVHLLAWGAAGIAVQDDGTSTVQPEGSVAQYGEVSCVVVATNTWSVQGAVA